MKQKKANTNIIKKIFNLPISFIKYFFIGLKYLLLALPLFIKRKIFPKKKNPQQIISFYILLLSTTAYLLSIFLLTKWFVQYERNKNFINSLTEQETFIIKEENNNQYTDTNNTNTPENNTEIQTNQTPPTEEIDYSNYTPTFLNINLNNYINQNKETVGWIKIDGTKVNYPIVQHNDNKYYLEHDFYNHKTNVGWIYGDYRNNFETLDNNTIIYGHNLIDKSMFGQLPNFLNHNWTKNNKQHYIKLQTKNQNTIWEIFSVYKIEPITDYLQTKFSSIESYETFLNTLKNRSVHKLNVELNYTDKILTLSTCDNTGRYRVAIHAKLIQIQ